MQWHPLDHMQTICTSLQTDNHTNTSSLKFFTSRMLFLTPSQQCQSTEGNIVLQFSCNDIVTCDCSAVVDIEAVEKRLPGITTV